MKNKTACFVFMVLCTTPVFAIDATPTDAGKNINDTQNSSNKSSGNTTKNDNNIQSNQNDNKNTIQDPNHPMNYCREHTC
jgi:hypothetical protein